MRGIDRTWSRRTLLATTAPLVVTGAAGCAGLQDGDNDIQDSDGDGVINSEDYAPRDPEVQAKSDLVDNQQAPTTTERPAGSDTDGDGAPDSEDYAPRDPDVQNKSDLQPSNTVFADFETGGDLPSDWHGKRGYAEVTTAHAAPGSNASLRIQCTDCGVADTRDVYKRLSSPIRPSRISYWLRSGAMNDQRQIWELEDDRENNIRVASGKDGRYILNGMAVSITPSDGTWYQYVAENIQWQRRRFDESFRNAAGEVLDEATGVDLRIRNFNGVHLRNRLTSNTAWMYTDDIIYRD